MRLARTPKREAVTHGSLTICGSGQAREIGIELRAHRSSLKSYLARRTRSHEDVDDLVQEVYLRVLSAGVHFGHVTSWRAMLFRIASATLVDSSRRKRARGEGLHDPIDGLLTLTDGSGGPDDFLQANQTAACLRDALMTLDPLRRQIFILARFERMSHKEIGHRLDMEPVKVGRQLERAVVHLMKAVADQ